MLPDNFDFAMLPTGSTSYSLKELGMLASTIEDIDTAIVNWVKGLNLYATTNEGYVQTPVLWQTPERAFQIKMQKELRDDAGALKLPLVSVERTAITKDPTRKGGFQAHVYSDKKDGRAGRWTIAKRISTDKTRNFAVVGATRGASETGGTKQRYYPGISGSIGRPNKKIIIQSLSIPIPIYVNVDYKIVIKSEYQQQMNSLIAPFIARTGQINAFVMRRNGHLYEGFVDQGFVHNNNISNLGEDVRMFSSEITIKVLGYLVGEGENDDRPIVRLDENIVEISFPQERTAPEGVPNIFGDIIK
tara:strand:- start:174 stop:1082 length:909 start_codon:yes stop_codon:yes gene_type:complete